MRIDTVAGLTSNFLTDALGSPVAVADNAGVVQTQYTYEPFGKTTFSGASNSSSYQYTGRENDGTGLYYYRARFYHPLLQRFIAEDPIEFGGGDVNLYAYVVNNPLRFVDPFGWVPYACKDPALDCGPPDSSPWDPPPQTLPKSHAKPPKPPDINPNGPTPNDWKRAYDEAMGNACETAVAAGCMLTKRQSPPGCAALAVAICNFRPRIGKR